MSIIAGITGQPAELIDGAQVPNGKPLQVDSVTEKTTGSGVSIQGRTNGTPIEAGKVGEKIEAAITPTYTTSSGTLVTSSAALPITKGRWDISYFGLIEHVNTSSTSVVLTRLYNSSTSAEVTGSRSAVLGTASGSTYLNIYNRTVIDLAADCNIILQISCSQSDTAAKARFLLDLTGVWSGEDVNARIIATRIA